MKYRHLAYALVFAFGCGDSTNPPAGSSADASQSGGADGSNNSGNDGGNADCSVPVLLAADGCDQRGNFIDTSKSCGAGGSYPMPEISVTCDTNTVRIESNGIPNFNFVPITPNALQENEFVFQIPRNPTVATNKADVPLLGAAAVAVNGLPIFGPTEAPQMGSRDPYLDQILDYCNGHTAMGGVYHFHARPECLYQNAAGQTSLVLAYAFDGFPILAPYVCEDASCTSVSEISSSWRQIEDVYGTSIENAWDAHEYVASRSALDECNGMTMADGSYAYFATDTFPYFIGCYHGNATGSMTGGGGGPPGQ